MFGEGEGWKRSHPAVLLYYYMLLTSVVGFTVDVYSAAWYLSPVKFVHDVLSFVEKIRTQAYGTPINYLFL